MFPRSPTNAVRLKRFHSLLRFSCSLVLPHMREAQVCLLDRLFSLFLMFHSTLQSNNHSNSSSNLVLPHMREAQVCQLLLLVSPLLTRLLETLWEMAVVETFRILLVVVAVVDKTPHHHNSRCNRKLVAMIAARTNAVKEIHAFDLWDIQFTMVRVTTCRTDVA